MKLKQCIKCKENKPEHDFEYNPYEKDNLHKICNKCDWLDDQQYEKDRVARKLKLKPQ